MVNFIWFFMIGAGILMLIVKGDSKSLIDIMTISAENSVKLLIELAGIMALWSGIMKICEKAGIIDFLGRALSPFIRVLFPGLNKKSKSAEGSIIMNIAANMLGLSNAATPFGINAMEELQKINPDKYTASQYMITFIIINGACIQFIPSTVISMRASLLSKNPAGIIIPTILTTFTALLAGLISNKLLKKIYK
jgi:spore maturation protein A